MIEPSYPIKIPSPVRFLLLAPAEERPVEFIKSTDDVSDLKGYYSLRDHGYSAILDRSKDLSVRPANFLELLPVNSPISLNSVDVWVKLEGEHREQLYSLIFDLEEWSFLKKEDREEIEKRIQRNMYDIVKCVSEKRYARAEYIAESLAALFSIVFDLGRAEKTRRELRRSNLRLFALFYAILIVALIAIVAVRGI